MTIQRTTVRLPKELLRLAKRKAAEEGRTLTALIEEGLRREVSGEHRALGQDDLEYAERLRKGFE